MKTSRIYIYIYRRGCCLRRVSTQGPGENEERDKDPWRHNEPHMTRTDA